MVLNKRKRGLATLNQNAEVESRIKESRNIESKIWHKRSYNCEHWAREMAYGEKECLQLTEKLKERKANRANQS
jgi:hypothetical protein